MLAALKQERPVSRGAIAAHAAERVIREAGRRRLVRRRSLGAKQPAGKVASHLATRLGTSGRRKLPQLHQLAASQSIANPHLRVRPWLWKLHRYRRKQRMAKSSRD